MSSQQSRKGRMPRRTAAALGALLAVVTIGGCGEGGITIPTPTRTSLPSITASLPWRPPSPTPPVSPTDHPTTEPTDKPTSEPAPTQLLSVAIFDDEGVIFGGDRWVWERPAGW